MKRLIKTFLICTVTTFMLSCSVFTAFAQEEDQNESSIGSEEKVIAIIGLYDPTVPSTYSTFYGNSGSIVVTESAGGIYYAVRLNVGVASFSGTISAYGIEQQNTGFSKYVHVNEISGLAYISFPKGNSSVSLSGKAIGKDGKSYHTIPNSIHVHR